MRYRSLDCTGESLNPPALDAPKHGKEDDLPHVGGSTYAGGTGGSNTAGLGGRGGPYRLDKGFPVHQVSDEAKAQVSAEAAAKARAMAEEALKKKLQDINMSKAESKMYTDILSVSAHVNCSKCEAALVAYQMVLLWYTHNEMCRKLKKRFRNCVWFWHLLRRRALNVNG